MRLLFSITLVLAAFSCKTTQTVSEVNSESNISRVSELICRSPIQDQKTFHVSASLTETDNASAASHMLLHWKITNSAGGVYESGQYTATSEELTTHQADIHAEKIQARFNFTARPTLEIGETIAPCTILWTQIQSPTGLKSIATCNAIGTPAQGWYVNGQLLKHSRSCNSETLACGSDPTGEGWFVQKKVDRVRLVDERCSWRKEKPVCKTKEGFSAWYLDDRLIARDDECHQKSIECNSTPSRGEGWIAFRRSEPQLLSAGACSPTGKGPKTAKNRTMKSDSSRDQVE